MQLPSVAQLETNYRIAAAAAAGTLHREVVDAQLWDVLTSMVFLRLCGVIFVRTFFQPDEYFQALEPAWQLAFGAESGAWLTWVCLRDIVQHRAQYTKPIRNGSTS